MKARLEPRICLQRDSEQAARGGYESVLSTRLSPGI